MLKKLPNIHPGEILLEEFFKPMEISQNKIVRVIGVPPRRIMKSYMQNGRLPPILLYAWQSTLALLNPSGWVCRLIMIWKKHAMSWAKNWIGLKRARPEFTPDYFADN